VDGAGDTSRMDGTDRSLYESDELPPEYGGSAPEPAARATDEARTPVDDAPAPKKDQKGPVKSPKNLSKAPEYVRTLAQHSRYLPAMAASVVLLGDFLAVIGAALLEGLRQYSAKYGGESALASES
jgi:hypothetical protein